jgi:hypothetical protein
MCAGVADASRDWFASTIFTSAGSVLERWRKRWDSRSIINVGDCDALRSAGKCDVVHKKRRKYR